jgi:hypothetical protein
MHRSRRLGNDILRIQHSVHSSADVGCSEDDTSPKRSAFEHRCCVRDVVLDGDLVVYELLLVYTTAGVHGHVYADLHYDDFHYYSDGRRRSFVALQFAVFELDVHTARECADVARFSC